MFAILKSNERKVAILRLSARKTLRPNRSVAVGYEAEEAAATAMAAAIISSIGISWWTAGRGPSTAEHPAAAAAPTGRYSWR